MKVLNYLEFNIRFAKQDIFSYEYRDFLLHKLKIKGFEDFMGFYCQSFKPELITELFDGWKITQTEKYPEHDGDDYGHTWRNEKNIQIEYDGYHSSRLMLYGEDMIFPRTLDDFITDCQRAGIELEWSS